VTKTNQDITPLPWETREWEGRIYIVGPDAESVIYQVNSGTGNLSKRYKANAEYTCKAANAYDEVLKGLYEVRGRLTMGQDGSDNYTINEDEIELITKLIVKMEG
jgi:hypothetical protein